MPGLGWEFFRILPELFCQRREIFRKPSLALFIILRPHLSSKRLHLIQNLSCILYPHFIFSPLCSLDPEFLQDRGRILVICIDYLLHCRKISYIPPEKRENQAGPSLKLHENLLLRKPVTLHYLLEDLAFFLEIE